MKENANPTVYSARNSKRTQEDDNTLIANHVLKKLTLPEQTTIPPSSLPTSEELSIHQAFCRISSQTLNYSDEISLMHNPIGFIQQRGKRLSSSDDSNNMLMKQCIFQPYAAKEERKSQDSANVEEVKTKRDPLVAKEIFDIIRNIQDPEHPLTLEQLKVVNLDHIDVVEATSDSAFSTVDVRFTPTIPHCSMATLIGLSIRVKLLRSLPKRFKVTVRINPGTHASELAVNRQLNDKERVIAALENKHLLGVVNTCISSGMESQG